MLFRRRIIAPATTEREVVVVRPKRPASLYAALGVATICAVGLIGYMTYALYENGQEDAMAATMAPEQNQGRAQRLATPTQQRTNRPSNTTIIVNPPPVIHVMPAAPNPPVVKPPEKTIIVEGAPQKTDEREEDPVKQTDEDLRDDSSSSMGEENSRPD